MNVKMVLAGVAAAVGVVLLAGRAPAQTRNEPTTQATTPTIDGSWTLNTDLSDNPQERMREAGGRGGPGGGGGGGGYPPGGMGGIGGRRGRGGMGGIGGRGGYGGGRAGMDPEAREKMRQAMRDLMKAPEHLSITRHEKDVVVADANGPTLTLRADGRKIKEKQADGTDIERKTKWNGPNLVTEVKGKNLPKITTTYARSIDGRHLSVSAKIDGGFGGRSMVVTHIYDPAQEGAPSGK